MGRLLFFITNVIIIIAFIAFFMVYLSHSAQVEQLKFAAKNSDVGSLAALQTPYIIFAFLLFFLHTVTACLRSEDAGLGTLFIATYAMVYFSITALDVYAVKIYPQVLSSTFEIVYPILSLLLFGMWLVLQFKVSNPQEQNLDLAEFEQNTHAQLRQKYRV
jgi:hypothetical protein